MATEYPAWITNEFVQKALENGKDYSVTIEDMEINRPVAKGNNFLSDIFGAKVEYRKSNDFNNLQKTSLIIKVPIIGELQDNVIGYGVVEKEAIIYNELSPKLNEIFGQNIKNDDDDELLPKSFFSMEKDVLILEDLKLKGYKLADRLKQLDFDHCVLALKCLAKFHAGSVIIHENEPEFIEKTVGYDAFFSEQDKPDLPMREFTVSSCKLLADTLKYWPEVKKYSKWFEENAESFWYSILEATKCNDNDFKVLAHGDFWISNLLFKYDDNNVPLKVKPIDFQTTAYSSPAIDFMNFMNGSAQENVRCEHYDELLNLYVNELNSILFRHGCNKRLEVCEFKKTIEERAAFRIYILVVVLPYVVSDTNESDILDLRNVSEEDFKSVENHPSKSYIKNEKYIKFITKILEELETMGLITAK